MRILSLIVGEQRRSQVARANLVKNLRPRQAIRVYQYSCQFDIFPKDAMVPVTSNWTLDKHTMGSNCINTTAVANDKKNHCMKFLAIIL